MIGINDIFQGYTVEHITHNIKTIIDRISEETPVSGLSVQSILPVNEHYFIIEDNLNAKIVKINQILEDFCKLRNITFIDLHKDFVKDGQLDPDFTFDGGHLTEQGYKKWAQLLQARLKL
jgi:lysophospholipase L1-like esterase